MISLQRFVLVAVCAILPACASTGSNAAATREPTTVLIQNQAVLDMTIYVLRGGQRIRLGLATGVSDTRLTIPPGIIFGGALVRFIADPIGSNRAPVSEEISVTEGDEIVLRIPPS